MKVLRKIKVNDKIYELSDMCKWEVRNGILWNLNSKHDEGVDGDEITYTNGGIRYRGHVEGYTCYQFISTKEWGKVILAAAEMDEKGVTFVHNTPVEAYEEDEVEEEPEQPELLKNIGNPLFDTPFEVIPVETLQEIEDAMYDENGWKDLGRGLKIDRHGNIAGGLKPSHYNPGFLC